MSVDLGKENKHTPVNLKKEEKTKKVILAKEVKNAGAPVGGAAAPVGGTTSYKGTGKKSSSKKWIGIAAAAVVIVGAIAAIGGMQSSRNNAVKNDVPASSTANVSSSQSTNIASSENTGTSETASASNNSLDTSNSSAATTVPSTETNQTTDAALLDNSSKDGTSENNSQQAGTDSGAETAEPATALSNAETNNGSATDSGSVNAMATKDQNLARDTSRTGAAATSPIAFGGSKRVGNYEVIVSNSTWNEAFDDCIKRGGHLCQINSAEENEAVISALKQTGFRGTVYLGGMRETDSKDYHWVDADKNLLSEVINEGEFKSFWLKDEPSYVDGAGREERYMTILYNKESGWVWNDVCEDVASISPSYYTGRVAYICEYN